MRSKGSVVTSAAEGEAIVRSHERYARIRVRIEPVDPPCLVLEHAIDPAHELFEFWSGVIDGVRLASVANESLAMKVTVLSAVVHPVDSRATSFARATRDAIAQAVAQCRIEAAELDRALFPWIETIVESARVTVGQGVVSSEPLDNVLEQPLSWSCQWATVDVDARAVVEESVEQLVRASPPWCNAMLHFGTSLSGANAPSSSAIREAIRSVLDRSRPVKRHARAMVVRDVR